MDSIDGMENKNSHEAAEKKLSKPVSFIKPKLFFFFAYGQV